VRWQTNLHDLRSQIALMPSTVYSCRSCSHCGTGQ